MIDLFQFPVITSYQTDSSTCVPSIYCSITPHSNQLSVPVTTAAHTIQTLETHRTVANLPQVCDLQWEAAPP